MGRIDHKLCLCRLPRPPAEARGVPSRAWARGGVVKDLWGTLGVECLSRGRMEARGTKLCPFLKPFLEKEVPVQGLRG